ncbi:MAG: heme utilization cystosolic carrier protein HutX [Xanthobacteraceae bacterium]|nr:heme utilization cystosolic carrier protein HutX [Xanthobacteraceae bacterium]
MLSADLADLRKDMAENPGVVIEDAARERGVTPRAIVEALPDAMRHFVSGDRFEAVMQDIAAWGEVTFIVHTDDAIFEFTGIVPKGQMGHGYFNLMQPKGLHGHFRPQRCGTIAFVERIFRNKSSAFVAFINIDGGIMYKVFVGRDESGALHSHQMARFRALAAYHSN